MAFNFPDAPSNGQIFSPAGGPTYTWRSPAWEVSGGSGGGASIIVSDTPPVDPPDNALWWDSTSGLLYLRYRDADTVQWVIAAPQPDTSVFLRKGVQTFTEAEQVQQRTNISAAPFDAMAYGGLQINGGMEVSQENGDAVGTGNGYYCDGWAVGCSAAIGASGFRVSGSTQIPGFPCVLYVGNGAIASSLAPGDYFFVYQKIEGYRIAKLMWGTASAQPITIGFWSAHDVVGTYSVSVENSAATYSYVTTYTQAASNVAQYNVVTIPGPTAGTWETTNGIGMYLIFAGAAGSTYTAPSINTWLAGDYFAMPGQVNAAAFSFAMRLTGVTVFPGTQAPTAAQSRNVMRPYTDELALCQRYWQTSATEWQGKIAYTNKWTHPFPVTMRTTPAMVYSVYGESGTFNTGINTYMCTPTMVCPGFASSTGTGEGYINLIFYADARL
jgi:hypothetical protein